MNLIGKIVGRLRGTDKHRELEMVHCVDFHDGTLRQQLRELANCFDHRINGVRVCCASTT